MLGFRFLRLIALLLAALVLMPFSSASAGERSAVKPGFTFPADRPVRILMFRPSITVGAQSTGGMFEPRSDWTDQARANIDAALTRNFTVAGNVQVSEADTAGNAAQLVAEHRRLFAAVAHSVIHYQFFKGNRLETKKRDNRDGAFSWSLGPQVSALPGVDAADYALFFNIEDQYGSTGRKLLQVFAAMSVGWGVQSGIHAGHAGLVDLRTGELVWINADNAMGGDVRTAEGADKRVKQLLEDFPGRAMVTPAVAGP